MVTLSTIFMIVALILFILAAINIPASRINLVAAGLAFWVAALLMGEVALR